MAQDVREFVDHWFAANGGPATPFGGDAHERQVEKVWTDFVVSASWAGYSLPQIEAEIGDLETYVRSHLKPAKRAKP
jgi:hypothetical protein